jgi:hypothetical protein
MVKVIYKGVLTGKQLGYSKSFKETENIKYRHYLVGSMLEPLSLPVKSGWTIKGILAKYYPKDQIKIVKEE